MGSTGTVLVIEDGEEDFQTVKRLLSKLTDHVIERCSDVPSADVYLKELRSYQAAAPRPWPSIILLDLNLPGEDGRSLLARLKRHEQLCRIPVVVLTTSSNSMDVDYCYTNGAAGYIVKPVDLTKFRDALEKLTGYWLCAVKLPRPLTIL